jgi:hypothetical protein
VRPQVVEFAARRILGGRREARQLGEPVGIVGTTVVVGFALQLLVAGHTRGGDGFGAARAAFQLAELVRGVVPVVLDVTEVLRDPPCVAVIAGDLLELVGVAMGFADVVAGTVDR